MNKKDLEIQIQITEKIEACLVVNTCQYIVQLYLDDIKSLFSVLYPIKISNSILNLYAQDFLNLSSAYYQRMLSSGDKSCVNGSKTIIIPQDLLLISWAFLTAQEEKDNPNTHNNKVLNLQQSATYHLFEFSHNKTHLVFYFLKDPTISQTTAYYIARICHHLISASTRKCAFCLKYSKEGMYCPTCEFTFYCSDHCQRQRWNTHMYECHWFLSKQNIRLDSRYIEMAKAFLSLPQ